MPPEPVGVVFSPGGRVYAFDAGGLRLAWNDRVVCPTPSGPGIGRVVEARREPDGRPLKRVLRVATAADEEAERAKRDVGRRALAAFREASRRAGVEAKPVAAEVALDGSRVVVSYQAEDGTSLGRLRSELAARLDRSVELRAVGPRECARLCGDVGLCGTGELCIRRFPTNEKPVTLRMAREQELPMSSGRITGLCGRLRCCLAYEHPVYASFRRRAPRVGARVETPGGRGTVADYAVLRDACVVELEAGGGRLEVAVDDCVEAGRV